MSNWIKIAAPWEIIRVKYPAACGDAKCKDNENADKIARDILLDAFSSLICLVTKSLRVLNVQDRTCHWALNNYLCL